MIQTVNYGVTRHSIILLLEIYLNEVQVPSLDCPLQFEKLGGNLTISTEF